MRPWRRDGLPQRRSFRLWDSLPIWLFTFLAICVLGMAVLGATRMPASMVVRQTIQEAVISARAGLAYDVEVTAATSIWPAGTRLESDRALYSYAGSPVMHVRPYVDLAGPHPGTLENLALLAVDLSGSTPLGKPLWSTPAFAPENRTEAIALPGGGSSVRIEGPEVAVDMADAHARTKRIREELGFIQSEDGLAVTFTATVRAIVDGTAYELPMQVTLPVHLQEDGFVPGALAKATQTVEAKGDRVEESQVPVAFAARLAKQVGWLAAALTLGAAGGAFAFLRRPRRRSGILLPPEYRRFKDWITVGRVGVPSRSVVEVQSLEGLVDLAIDMNKRVIFDLECRCCTVVDGEVAYRYCPPSGRQTADK